MSLSISIVDPQYLTRNGLQAQFASESGITVAQVTDHLANLQEAQIKAADVLILDYPYKESAIPIQHFERIFTLTNVLVITADRDQLRIKQLIDAGAKGFLTKNCSYEEIKSALKAVSVGQRFFCNTIMDIILEQSMDDTNPTTLSPREYEILKLIALGHTTSYIAEQLHISVHTVNTHRKNILKKLRLKSPTQLVAYAIDTGLVKL